MGDEARFLPTPVLEDLMLQRSRPVAAVPSAIGPGSRSLPLFRFLLEARKRRDDSDWARWLAGDGDEPKNFVLFPTPFVHIQLKTETRGSPNRKSSSSAANELHFDKVGPL